MDLPQTPPIPAQHLNYKDESHLNLLSVFHYAVGGLRFLAIGFLVLHFTIMSAFFRMAPAMHSSPSANAPALIVENAVEGSQTEATEIPDTLTAPDPGSMLEHSSGIMMYLMVVYIAFGALVPPMAIENVMSGTFIRKRKHKTFTCVISGVN